MSEENTDSNNVSSIPEQNAENGVSHSVNDIAAEVESKKSEVTENASTDPGPEMIENNDNPETSDNEKEPVTQTVDEVIRESSNAPNESSNSQIDEVKDKREISMDSYTKQASNDEESNKLEETDKLERSNQVEDGDKTINENTEPEAPSEQDLIPKDKHSRENTETPELENASKNTEDTRDNDNDNNDSEGHEKKVQDFLNNEEKVEQYSDDEISVSGSSSESESSSDSDSSESSDSSDESEDENTEKADMDDFDDEEEVSGGPIVSKNEQVDEKAFTLPEDYAVPENAPLEFVGVVTGLVERSAIIKANVSGEFRVLKDNSVLCFEDKQVLGPLFETFGKLQAPYYRVKFNSEEEFAEIRDKKGAKVFYVVPESQFIYTDAIKKIKGTDASNCHDEELPEEEQEFSDDEQELAAKQQRKKKKKKSKDAGDEPLPKKQNTRPELTKFTSYGFAPSASSRASLPKVPQTNTTYNSRSQARPPPSQMHAQPQQAYSSPSPYGVPLTNFQNQYTPQNVQNPYQPQQFLPQVPNFPQQQPAYGQPQNYWPQQVPQQAPQPYQPQQPYQPMYQQQAPYGQPQQPQQSQPQHYQQLPQPQGQQYCHQPQQNTALHQLHALVSNQLNQQGGNQQNHHQHQGPN